MERKWGVRLEFTDLKKKSDITSEQSDVIVDDAAIAAVNKLHKIYSEGVDIVKNLTVVDYVSCEDVDEYTTLMCIDDTVVGAIGKVDENELESNADNPENEPCILYQRYNFLLQKLVPPQHQFKSFDELIGYLNFHPKSLKTNSKIVFGEMHTIMKIDGWSASKSFAVYRIGHGGAAILGFMIALGDLNALGPYTDIADLIPDGDDKEFSKEDTNMDSLYKPVFGECIGPQQPTRPCMVHNPITGSRKLAHFHGWVKVKDKECDTMALVEYMTDNDRGMCGFEYPCNIKFTDV